MQAIKFISAAAVAFTLTLGAASGAFAANNPPPNGGQQGGGNPNNVAEGQNIENFYMHCERDFYSTADCGPTSGASYGPYDRAHAFERGDHIQR
jgi:hypothetical protein